MFKFNTSIDRQQLIGRLLFSLYFIIFFIAFGSIIYYQWTGLKLHFFHESAFPLLYAQNILDTHLPFSSSFSGREISPLSWPIIGALWLSIFGEVNLTVHSLMVTSFTFFVAMVTYFFSQVAGFSRFTTFFFMTLFFIVFTQIPSYYNWADQVWVWPMNSYGVYDMFSLISLTLFFSIYKKESTFALSDIMLKPTNRYLIYFTLICLWYFATGLNSTRGFLTIPLPIFVAIFFEYINANTDTQKKLLKLSIPLFISALVGLVLILLLTKGTPQPWQDVHKHFTITNFDQFRDRILAFPHTWLSLFGAIPHKGIALFSFEGIRSIFLSIFSIFIFVLPFFRIRNKEISFFERIVIYRYFFVLLLILIASIYGTASGSQRYMIPLAYAAFFVLPFTIDSWVKSKRFFKPLVIVFLLVPSYITSVNSLTQYDTESYTKNKMYRLGVFLQKEGLDFGYAGPWAKLGAPWKNGFLTLWEMTDEKVKIALIDPIPFVPHGHADKKWFDYSESNRTTFIAVPKDMYIQSPKIQELSHMKSGSLEFEDIIIDVYPFNVGKYLGKRW